ncbi:MAG TPA: hypothetical protein PKV21_02665 [bacterium]|nr:hypothetical protein [bacterium]HOM26391.1 hypothetical protein [bacterium]
MAKGRTISATELTEKDKAALEICRKISDGLADLITNTESRKDFVKNYGRIHLSRDAGLGMAGAKLQRDALCTRGRTDKAPYSNRNLRWHPLIVANEIPEYAKEVEYVSIDNKSLVFVINGELWYPKDVHKLEEVYCVPYDKWYAIKDDLLQWTDDDWTNNSCVIPAMEYSTLEYSVETFAILGIAVVSNFYGVNPVNAYNLVKEIFLNSNYNPTREYPNQNEIQEIILCPLCRAPLNKPPANLSLPEREEVFQPPWRKSKREEGEAESLQLFHTFPLKESKILHTPRLVRYGHRWCNVAMADHSVDETVEFMQAVVDAHERKKKNRK